MSGLKNFVLFNWGSNHPDSIVKTTQAQEMLIA
jgi:hypothetical protein